MMPVSGYMDSNPHLRNQVPYSLHHFPGSETFQPHFMVDPSKSPMIYESWPCSSNCSRYPVPYHGCCSHGNFPGYYTFRPPYPHYAPSPAFHQYPHYPTSAEPYPVYYVPPRYSNEPPRYEYDKYPHMNYHCCGCPNHVHNQKKDGGLKIEEQENDAEKIKGDSVVPAQPRNFPYPIVWIPPEYVKSTEQGKHRVEESDSDKTPSFSKTSKSSKPTEQQPRVRNNWFPLDMNELKPLMQGEGKKQSHNHQNPDNMMQFPFPIVWVPNSDRKHGEDENQEKRKTITASDHSEQSPVNMERNINDAKINNPPSDKEISQNKNAAEICGKTAGEKCVPIEVKEAKSAGTQNKVRDISVKGAEDTAKNAVGTNPERKSLSPTKRSKLPPVCLRLDPLPKKRNGSGSSRFPSPPNGQSENKLTKASTAPVLKEDPLVNTQNISSGPDNAEPAEKIRRDIPVIEEKPKENKAVETTGVSQAEVSQNSEDKTNASFGEGVGAEKEAASVKAANPDEPAQCKEVKTMSDGEAAKHIQSAFRGFEVRKWEPLKKLKEIANVSEQVDEVRNRIQSLESSSDHDKDDKLRLLIGEKIMSLLLRLDTIQGLHSSVRDARKSLVRELVTLQERLDSLTSKWAEEKAKDLGTAESADCRGGGASGNVGIGTESENVLPALENENGNNIRVPEHECLPHIVDDKDEETTGANIKNDTTEVTSVIKCRTPPGMEGEDTSPNLEHMTHMSSVPEQKLNTNDFVEANNMKEKVEANAEILVDSNSEDDKLKEANDQILVGSNSEDDELKSSTNAGNMDVVCESEEGIENSNGEKESDLPINPSLPDEVDNLKCTEKEDQKVDLLKELPLGVVDEEPAVSEIDLLKELPLGVVDEEPTVSISKIDGYIPEAESNGSVEDEKENEFTYNPELEVEMDQKEVNGDNHSESFEEQVEVHSTVGEENSDKLSQHENDSGEVPADVTASSESETGSEATQDKQVLFEEKKGAEQAVGTEEEEDVPSESNAGPELAKIGENKLIEENKKLKEIMEKLMEAGKDQLSVISNLTERVKDLEERLARTQKSSKPGNRKVRYAPSYNNPVRAKRRVAEAA